MLLFSILAAVAAMALFSFFAVDAVRHDEEGTVFFLLVLSYLVGVGMGVQF